MDLKDIKAIIDLMKKNSISEFELERQDFKVRLKRGVTGPVVIAEDAQTPTMISVSPVPLSLPAGSPAPASLAGASEIKSPMIGTLYRAPSPEAANYVEIGSEVGLETVVCLIEAMKVMNEIKAEKSGTITACVAEDCTPVQYGDVLFRIK